MTLYVDGDAALTWAEFYEGVECAAAEAAFYGRELTWTFDPLPGVAVAVLDAAGTWAYVVAK